MDMLNEVGILYVFLGDILAKEREASAGLLIAVIGCILVYV